MRHMNPVPVKRTAAAADPRLLGAVRHIALAGLAIVLVWPAARGSSAWLGWLPLWLLGMPLIAWWALLRFPLPRWPQRRVQARRRSPRLLRRPALGATADVPARVA